MRRFGKLVPKYLVRFRTRGRFGKFRRSVSWA